MATVMSYFGKVSDVLTMSEKCCYHHNLIDGDEILI